ncbi:ABC transporter ATP-binding protein [Microvirga brassicacearum]|uniref:ABC transporter ATP-binding protein n=1 Tax=Microvirga brassicacearum TaxID=2580413 RepID=A0A5N3PDB9_9HYPH|nr:ABC transporter ATP-binding protein [Microvirga brassicacearum]KAB0267701.1 ABC transporter ATP-binding protein [Microvirga brassicacearum]
MSEIVVNAVSKSWGGVGGVDRVSFKAEAGTLLVLLGPSGCGKSTTLRLIAGLEEIESGHITIGGRDVTHLSPAERRISMVFQSYALFPHLSVAENIIFGLKVRRVGRAERDERLKKVADIVGLSQLLDRKPSQLSGGQRQRVALGRAIIAEAAVCLMDEPLSNLDAKLRHEMRTEIRSLQQRLGMTMVYVTHDQTEAMTMADRVILMRDGQIEQNGAPHELYNQPASDFAARFIGTPPMNIISWRDDTSLGVRPEHITLDDHDGVSATIKAVEYLGADSIIICDVKGETVAVRQSGYCSVTTGTKVNLGWQNRHVHLFEKNSGKRREGGLPQ